MELNRRSFLSGLVVTAVAALPVAKIVRATEMPEYDEFLFTSSWYEQLEKGLWRQRSYRFQALEAPRILIVNASPDAREIAGVQLDWDVWPFSRQPQPNARVMPDGWERGHVDVTNRRGVDLELTRADEQQLIERQRRPTTIIRPSEADIFGFYQGDGAFV
jgi:hypothetical protein